MPKSELNWVISPDALWPRGFSTWLTSERQLVAQILKEFEPRIKDWMKTQAPWNDITGEARKQLEAKATTEWDALYIDLYHGVPYGKYLEFANGGKYQVIGPALDHWAPLVFAEVQARLFGT